MQHPEPPSLTSSERTVVDAEVRLWRARGPRRDPQLLGCAVAFAGMLVLTLTPALGSWVEIPLGMGSLIFWMAVLALFAGAGVALVGARRARGTTPLGVRLDDAVGPILAATENGASRDEALRAATRLLLEVGSLGGVRPPGAGASLESTAKRLGPAGVELVRSVERYLLETDARLRPVFDEIPGDGP